MIDHKKIALMEAVNTIPIDKDFKVPDGFIIPLRSQLYVKRENKNYGLNRTEGGLIIPDTAPNTVVPDVGTVYAVGDEVSDFVFPGLKVTFQGEIPYMEVMINGIVYLRMFEHELLGILPPKSFVYQGVRSAAYMQRVKRNKEFADLRIRQAEKKANDLDKQIETKKKTRK